MLSRSMLRWPWLTVAFFVTGMLCLSTSGTAGLLLSRTQESGSANLSRTEIEREIITISLEKMGFSREEAVEKLSCLSEKEIRRLAGALEKITAGGEEEDQGSRALGVGLVIVIVLAVITGLYLFSEAN